MKHILAMEESEIKFLRSPATNLYGYPVFRYVLQCLELHPEDRVLDAGCGIGIMDFTAGKEVKKITGIDISEPAVNFLKRKYPGKNGNFHAVNITEEIPEELKGQFDKVVCIDVLEHVKGPDKAMRFIIKAMAEKGMSVITFPINTVNHGNTLTREDAEKLAAQIPLQYEIIFLEEKDNFLSYIFRMVRKLFKAYNTDNFEETLSYKVFVKYAGNIPLQFFLLILRLPLVILSKFTGNNLRKTQNNPTRCTIIIKNT
ncbi:MAG: class I SAM-dependent methyltransferase [Endomicrobiales bacterium]|nr:class I SAM-dependent methyltransferase [Endomicrobiales bacterium]